MWRSSSCVLIREREREEGETYGGARGGEFELVSEDGGGGEQGHHVRHSKHLAHTLPATSSPPPRTGAVAQAAASISMPTPRPRVQPRVEDSRSCFSPTRARAPHVSSAAFSAVTETPPVPGEAVAAW